MYSVYYRLAQHGTPYIGEGEYKPERWVNKDKNRQLVKQLNAEAEILDMYVNENNSKFKYPLKFVKNAYNKRDVIYLDIDGTAEFAVEIEHDHFPNLPTACEVSVWRNTAIFGFKYLTKFVFWKYVYPIHNAVITDGTHFPPMISFYEKRIDEAYKKGLNVYFVDLKKKQPIQYLIPREDFPKYVDQIWGVDFFTYVNRRILITDKVLI